MNLVRRPLKTLVKVKNLLPVQKDDANAAPGSPSYLRWPTINQAGTMRDVPSLGPSMHLRGRLGGM